MIANHRHDDPRRARAAAARDAALRRMSRLNAVVVGGALVLVAGCTALAARASTAQTTPHASPASHVSAPRRSSNRSATPSAPTATAAQASAPSVAVAPAPTQQAPAVVSGGS